MKRETLADVFGYTGIAAIVGALVNEAWHLHYSLGVIATGAALVLLAVFICPDKKKSEPEIRTR